MTLVTAIVAGGSHIDHADLLRSGGIRRVLPFQVMAPSTLGTFLRAFSFGHVRQLEAVVGEVLRRAGAAGEIVMRFDSGFWSNDTIATPPRRPLHDGRGTNTKGPDAAIAAIDEDAWVDIDYPAGGQAQVGECTYKGRRLIVRRTRLTDRRQAALWPDWRHFAFLTDLDGDAAVIDAFHRHHAVVELAIRDLKEGAGMKHVPSGDFSANSAWLQCAVMAHNLVRWTATLGQPGPRPPLDAAPVVGPPATGCLSSHLFESGQLSREKRDQSPYPAGHPVLQGGTNTNGGVPHRCARPRGEFDMANRRLRRMAVGAAMTGALVMTSAGPAFAHFCRKVDFNPTAAAHAGASKAWLTAAEWRGFLPFIEPDCPGITSAIEPILLEAEQSGTTLFMGPGLLAGGTLKNGKDKTPSHFDYVLLEAFMTYCPSGE